MRQRLGAMLAAAIALSFGFLALAMAGDDVGDPTRYSGRLENRKMVCMLQDTVQAREGLEHVYNGKKYYLCCGGCLAGFEKDPTRYSHAIDPVNGKSVDKADASTYAYRGHAYFFSSEETLTTFAKEPERYLLRATAAGTKPTRQ